MSDDVDLARHPDSDFLGFELLLDDEDRELLSEVRAFMTTQVEPVINDYWTRAAFPHELVPGIAELGIAGLPYDGPRLPGRGALLDGMVAMELARVDPSIADLHGRARRPGDGLDRPVRLRRAARALAAGDGADGADRRLRADRARRRLRRSPAGWPRPPGATATSWVLDGEKKWIGNATFADLVVIWARDVDDDQVKGFVVEKGTPGMTFDKHEDKIALRVVQNAEIHLHDVRVPGGQPAAEGELASRTPPRCCG